MKALPCGRARATLLRHPEAQCPDVRVEIGRQPTPDEAAVGSMAGLGPGRRRGCGAEEGGGQELELAADTIYMWQRQS